ncbi:MAG TPA: tetratricopeptide repeat protein, partial [Pyrinomonadaceae bacterium]|nr:tetratricopeptide repeat protein [Pyrinomonadaceae bacterium]
EVVSIVAARYAKLELFDHAIELADTISDPFARDNTLTEIAAASIATGAPEYSDALLEMIEDVGARSVAIEATAVKYAERGDLDKSIELANELDDSDPTLSRIALANGTFSPRSVEIASSITASELRSTTLGQLAALAHRTNLKSEAEELLAESLQAADEVEFSQNRIYALVGVASVYTEIGETDQARETLSRALEECETFEGQPAWGLPASFPRDAALAQIVEGFARLGHFDQADVAAEQIEDPFQFANASTKEALEYFRAGQVDQAHTLLSEALELVLEEAVYGEQGMLVKDSVLVELAMGFAITGQLEKGLQVTTKISSEHQHFNALEQLGKQCARAGNSHGVFQVAQSITNSYSTTSYWLAISDFLRELSAAELVQQALFEAATSAAMIEHPYEKTVSLIEVGYRVELTNDSAKASELFSLALKTINQLEEDYKKALSLLRIDQRFRELKRIPNEEERYLLGQ